jgi:hypothetical protein
MWHYETLAYTALPGDKATGFLDPAVYLNRLEECGHETDALVVIPNMNRILIRHRPRQVAADGHVERRVISER